MHNSMVHALDAYTYIASRCENQDRLEKIKLEQLHINSDDYD